jgi:hypothetical protein
MATFEDFKRQVEANIDAQPSAVARESGPVVRMWFAPGCEGNEDGSTTIEAVTAWAERMGYRATYDELADVFSFRRVHLEELRASLYLVPRHLCNEYARHYLFPPNKGTDGFVKLSLREGKIEPVAYWYIDLGDGGPLLPVDFCPWCGVRLVGDHIETSYADHPEAT